PRHRARRGPAAAEGRARRRHRRRRRPAAGRARLCQRRPRPRSPDRRRRGRPLGRDRAGSAAGQLRRGTAMIKLTFALTRLPHLTREAFQTYWLETHAPLVASVKEALRIRRYVQLHSLPAEVSESL